jgi:hypothetical protein
MSLYQEYLHAVAAANADMSSATSENGFRFFSQFSYPVNYSDSRCPNWNSFVGDSMQLPVPSMGFDALSIKTVVYDFKTQTISGNRYFTCSNGKIVTEIVNSLLYSTSLTRRCDNHTWTVQACAFGPSLCADCGINDESCVLEETCPSPLSIFPMSPCNECAYNASYLSFYHLVRFNISTKLQSPQFNGDIKVISSTRDSVTVNASITGPGTIFCNGLVSDSPAQLYLNTVTTIKSGNYFADAFISTTGFGSGYSAFQAATSTEYNATVVVAGLTAMTNYSIYCYVQGSDGTTMSIEEVRQTAITAETKCCKQLFFSQAYSRIAASNSSSSVADLSIFELSVDAMPAFDNNETILSVQCNISEIGSDVSLQYPQCASLSSSSENSSATLIPGGLLSFSSTSSPPIVASTPASTGLVIAGTRRLIVQGSTGCYRLSCSPQNYVDMYPSNVSTVIGIHPDTTASVVPALSTISFSSGGDKLNFVFDIATDRSATYLSSVGSSQYSSFQCSELFRFKSSADWICVWNSDTVVSAYYGVDVRYYAPTSRPTSMPTGSQSTAPSSSPSSLPSLQPSASPTIILNTPTLNPTTVPTASPTVAPSALLSASPTTHSPSVVPTEIPSAAPSASPTARPTISPTAGPTYNFTSPTPYPTTAPTASPTKPSAAPTPSPSPLPSVTPTFSPTPYVPIYDLELPSVGDVVILNAGRVQAASCAGKNNCGYNAAAVKNITSTMDAVTPVIVLSAPAVIGFCSGIIVDPTSTYGHGGRAWASVRWAISFTNTQNSSYFVNTTYLTQYFNTEFNSTAVIASFTSNEILNVSLGQYRIDLTVTNFLGKSASASVFITKRPVVVPLLSVLGSQSYSITRQDLLNVYTTTSVAALKCSELTEYIVAKSRYIRQSVSEGDLSSSLISLKYQWSVYNNNSDVSSSFESASKSASLSSFTVAPYTFNPASAYYLIGRVTPTTTSSVVARNVHLISVIVRVSVDVSNSGLYATIYGGSTRSVSAHKTSSPLVSLDASGSRDLDYQAGDVEATSSLMYYWSCTDNSPVSIFGDSCSNALLPTANASIRDLNVTSLDGSGVTSVVVSVIVSSTHSYYSGVSASASTTINVITYEAPLIFISASNGNSGRVAPNNKILVTGYISTAGSGAGYEFIALWSVSPLASGLSIDDIALSPVVQTLRASDASTNFVVAQLVLAADALTPGATYAFQLSTVYSSSNITNRTSTGPVSASLEITVNSPPHGGLMSVLPSVGTTLDTLFAISTSYWVDDIGDYPLTYLFTALAPPSTTSSIIKYADALQSVNAFLGAGFESNNHLVTISVTAADVYGSTQVINSNVTVLANDGSSFGHNNATGALAVYMKQIQVATVNQLLSAATTNINTVVCGNNLIVNNGTSCQELNRHSCWSTANTCGACLGGYYGVLGDSNEKCMNSTEFVLKNSVSATAVDGKACSQNCSGTHGECVYHSSTNARVAQCPKYSSNCYAVCNCFDDWFGSDCSLTYAQLVEETATREQIALYVRELSELQAVTVETVISQSQLISGLMKDSSVVSNRTMILLAETLLGSITSVGGQQLLASSQASQACIDALSTIVDYFASIRAMNSSSYTDQETAVVNNVTAAIAMVAAGVSSSLGVGEHAFQYISNNIRVSSVITSPSAANSSGLYSFGAPQSESERLLNTARSSISVNMSNWLSGPMASSVTQYLKSPYGTNSSAQDSIQTLDADLVGLSLVLYSLAGSTPTTSAAATRRRLLVEDVPPISPLPNTESGNVVAASSSAESGKTLDIVFVMKNVYPTDYNRSLYALPYNGTVYCDQTTNRQPYYLNITCSKGGLSLQQHLSFRCSGQRRRMFQYQCPGQGALPHCAIYDSHVGSYVLDSHCQVVDFTSTTTTCLCRRNIVDYNSSLAVSLSDVNVVSFVSSSRGLSSTQISAASASASQSSKSSSVAARLQEMNSYGKAVASNVADTLAEITQLDASSLRENAFILSIMIVLVVVCFVGLGVVIWVDWKEQKIYDKQKQKHMHMHISPGTTKKMSVDGSKVIEIGMDPEEKTASFIEVVHKSMPYDLVSNANWYFRFWHAVKVKHDLVGLFSKYSPEGDFRTIHWLRFFVMVLCYFFVNAVLTVNYFDEESCAVYLSASECESVTSLDQTSAMCVWVYDDDMMLPPGYNYSMPITAGQCVLNQTVAESPFSTVVLLIVSTLISVPLHVIFVVMIMQARSVISLNCFGSKEIEDHRRQHRHHRYQKHAIRQVVDSSVAANNDPISLDILSDLQFSRLEDPQLYYMIGARLTVLSQKLDDATILEEVNHIAHYLRTEVDVAKLCLRFGIKPRIERNPDGTLVRRRRKPRPSASQRSSAKNSSKVAAANGDGDIDNDANASSRAHQRDLQHALDTAIHSNHNSGRPPSENRSQPTSSRVVGSARNAAISIRNVVTSVSSRVADDMEVFADDMRSGVSKFQQRVITVSTRLTTASKPYSHLIDAFTSRRQLRNRVKRARYETNLMQQQLEVIRDRIGKEVYMLRQFVLHMLNYHGKSIANRFFSVFFKDEFSVSSMYGWVPYASTILLPFIIIFMALYIFLFGVRLGPRASRQWILSCCLSWLHVMLFLRPLSIWIRTYLLSSFIRHDILEILSNLGTRARSILRRGKHPASINCRGMITRAANNLIQSLNPACRVARVHPELTVSRLLICVNDFDFPQAIYWNADAKEMRIMMYQIVILAVFIAVGFLPEQMQDVIIDGITSTSLNALLLGFAIFGRKALFYCLFTVFVLVSAVFLFCFMTVKTKKVLPLLFSVDDLDLQNDADLKDYEQPYQPNKNHKPQDSRTNTPPDAEHKHEDDEDDGEIHFAEYEEFEKEQQQHIYSYSYTAEEGVLV